MATSIELTLSAVVREAYATINAALGGLGFEATPWPYELMPVGESRSHRTYGVGVIRATPLDPLDKQANGRTLNSLAEVGVRLQVRLRPEDPISDYQDAQLDGDLVLASMIDEADSGSGGKAQQKWHWLSTTCRIVGDGTFLLIEQRYRCFYISVAAL